MRWAGTRFFDSTFISVTTFWFALEDATLANGCLWVQPGGGQRGPLRERFARADDVVTMEKLDATTWPDRNTAVPLKVKAGTLVVFHGPRRTIVQRTVQRNLATPKLWT